MCWRCCVPCHDSFHNEGGEKERKRGGDKEGSKNVRAKEGEEQRGREGKGKGQGQRKRKGRWKGEAENGCAEGLHAHNLFLNTSEKGAKLQPALQHISH